MSKQGVVVNDGKYTFFLDTADGLLNCDRHGEPWPEFRRDGAHFQGCFLALFFEAQRLQARVTELENCVDDTQGQLDYEMRQGFIELAARLLEKHPDRAAKWALENAEALFRKAGWWKLREQRPAGQGRDGPSL